MRAAVSFRTDAFCFGAQALRRLGLDLSRFARLDVVTTAPDLAQDPRLHDAALEALQRPVDAIRLVQVNFYHRSSVGVDMEKRRAAGTDRFPRRGANPRPRRARAAVLNDRAWRRSRR